MRLIARFNGAGVSFSIPPIDVVRILGCEYHCRRAKNQGDITINDTQKKLWTSRLGHQNFVTRQTLPERCTCKTLAGPLVSYPKYYECGDDGPLIKGHAALQETGCGPQNANDYQAYIVKHGLKAPVVIG